MTAIDTGAAAQTTAALTGMYAKALGTAPAPPPLTAHQACQLGRALRLLHGHATGAHPRPDPHIAAATILIAQPGAEHLEAAWGVKIRPPKPRRARRRRPR